MEILEFSLTVFPIFFGVQEVVAQDLKLVNVLFRHGDRAPLTDDGESFPTSPYLCSKFLPYGPSQLTNEGRQREYDLGIHIRQQYDEFLGALYHPAEIIARSTDTDRTKMSLQLVMAGLFPPAPEQKWNPKLDWQPVIADYIPRTDSVVYPFDCPQYQEEFEVVEQSPDVQEEISQHSELLKNLTEWTGQPVTKAKDFEHLYGYLSSLNAMGLELPDWTQGIFPDGELLDLAVLSYRIQSYTQRLKVLNGGKILKNFTENMQAVVDGTESQMKMFLLSGHDLNIGALLIALEVYEPHQPQFSSAVFLELLEDEGEYFVSIFYYLGIPPERTAVAIPGCEKLCPFKKFVELYSQVIPTEEDMIC
ncbi:venom acid phosphatase Acph-1 [Diachasma alloeum]|uniref:venom acid phosphatase Acph-1 n=1 Tax=Diachasma alloeum TaxID=454923 RepID=UPI0007384C2D|nr:venom acid phosphatase Acph-1 [Diachasma alloeum]